MKKLINKLFKRKKEFPKRYAVYNGNYFVGYSEPLKSEEHAEEYMIKYFKYCQFNHENATCRIVNPFRKKMI
jgi:hypothetical protein